MVLWSYNTTARSTTGESPFSLTYGCEAMVPVEIGVGSFRRDNYNLEDNEVNQRLYLDLIEETRGYIIGQVGNLPAENPTGTTTQRYEARPLKAGDLVLRKVMPNTKVPGHGVFGANWEGPYKINSVLWEGIYHLTDMDGNLIPRAWNAESFKKILPVDLSLRQVSFLQFQVDLFQV